MSFIGARTLLLNSSYEPMRVVNWQKALILWFQGKVEVLEYHTIFAHSVRSSFQLPSVLRLKSYVRPRSKTPIRFCRENVYLRDDFTCQYCGIEFPTRQLTLDHVLPASKNGPKTWTNVVTCCRSCNQEKANRTPEQANMPLLSVPAIPSWMSAVALEVSNQHQVPASWLPYLPSSKAG